MYVVCMSEDVREGVRVMLCFIDDEDGGKWEVSKASFSFSYEITTRNLRKPTICWLGVITVMESIRTEAQYIGLGLTRDRLHIILSCVGTWKGE